MQLATQVGRAAGSIDDGRWVNEYLVEMQGKTDSHIRSRLRRDLYSRFGEDVRQEACCRLVLILRRGRYAEIDETNWREPDRRVILDRCMFATVNLTLLEMIRSAKKLDLGSDRIDQVAVEADAPAEWSEQEAQVTAALQERPERDRHFWQMAGIEGRSTPEIARLWGVSEVAVRVIRHRLLAWLRSQVQ